MEKLGRVETKLIKEKSKGPKEDPEEAIRPPPVDSLSGFIVEKMGKLPNSEASLSQAAKIIKEAVPEIEELQGWLREHLNPKPVTDRPWGNLFVFFDLSKQNSDSDAFAHLALSMGRKSLRVRLNLSNIWSAPRIEKVLEGDSTTMARLRSGLRSALTTLNEKAQYPNKGPQKTSRYSNKYRKKSKGSMAIAALLEAEGIQVRDGKIKKADTQKALSVLQSASRRPDNS